MFFFLGGSIGAALLTAILVVRGDGEGGLNPLHESVGAGYSDAFLALLVPLLVAAVLSRALPEREPGSGPA